MPEVRVCKWNVLSTHIFGALTHCVGVKEGREVGKGRGGDQRHCVACRQKIAFELGKSANMKHLASGAIAVAVAIAVPAVQRCAEIKQCH